MRIFYDWFEKIYSMDINEIDNTFPLLAEGSCRAVYTISNNLIMKLATKDGGVRQCKTENKVYSKCGSYLRKYLCPLIWYKHGMVVMEKAVPFIPLDWVVGDPQIDASTIGPPDVVYKDLRSLSKKFGLLYGDLTSATSWGYINDIPVLVDYGCTD